MWLLNATTRQLRFFQDDGVVHEQYAILSHTWGVDEVTFQDIRDLDTAKLKKGYAKIDLTCTQALKDGLAWVWIDTCCIDKSSSAELSEAINTMYRWYADAFICYAYLGDYQLPEEADPDMHLRQYLRHSKWFTRGWTLQELVAPSRIEFYGQEWTFIGSKWGLCDTLEQITSIPIHVLMDHRALKSVSVAKKMSWASQRQTTRIEDQAYCLLGIFDVNMPLLYGEGRRAFRRLQEVIMSSSTDHSIFVWEPITPNPMPGVMASSPSDFKHSGKVVCHVTGTPGSFELTNAGIRITLPLVKLQDNKLYIALECRYEDDFTGVIALQVEEADPLSDYQLKTDVIFTLKPNRTAVVWKVNRFRVVSLEFLRRMQGMGRERVLLVCQVSPSKSRSLQIDHGLTLCLQLNGSCSRSVSLVEAHPEKKWNAHTKVMCWQSSLVSPKLDGHSGYFALQISLGTYVTVFFRGQIVPDKPLACAFAVLRTSNQPYLKDYELAEDANELEWITVSSQKFDQIHSLATISSPTSSVQIRVCRKELMQVPVYVLEVLPVDETPAKSILQNDQSTTVAKRRRT